MPRVTAVKNREAKNNNAEHQGTSRTMGDVEREMEEGKAVQVARDGGRGGRARDGGAMERESRAHGLWR